jgi:hypothetical protein
MPQADERPGPTERATTKSAAKTYECATVTVRYYIRVTKVENLASVGLIYSPTSVAHFIITDH